MTTSIECPVGHRDFGSTFGLPDIPANSSIANDKDLSSMKLLTRIFSLLPTPPEIKGLRIPLRSNTLDFDLALFTTYA